MRYWAIAILAAAASACGQTDEISRDSDPFADISENETITAVGTEPFWTIEVTGDQATLSKPDDLEGTSFEVSRFAGNNGLGFSGEIDRQKLMLTITPGNCGDGMSDRRFPYIATVALADETLQGCAYTDRQGFQN